MKRPITLRSGSRTGSSLILALIFVGMFAALAVSMAAMSGMNIQIAENQRRFDTARSCALSGLEVVRYWMNQVSISGTTSAEQRFARVATDLQTVLTNAGVTNVVPVCSGSTVSMSNVSLDSTTGQTFSAVLTKIDNDTIQMDVTGRYGQVGRTIRSNYTLTYIADTVFDFGVATKGPLVLSGNVEIEGVNVAVESNAYIESLNTMLALSMSGNSEIAGKVKIVNPLATPFLGSKVSVGGAVGEDALVNIEKGVPASSFPEMTPSIFYSYATNTLRSTLDLKKNVTLTNIRIPAGMNPKFSGQATLQGVVLIEAPNVVEFTGGVSITGIIVTNGSQTDDSGTNQLIFRGHVAGYSVAQLPQEPQFAGLHSQTGTFIMAPGFSVSFGGTFDTLGGAIGANGVEFFGNAGGIIRGSVVNYADKDMKLWGNSSLMFNRSGLAEVPAGFVPKLVLRYDPSSYSEVTI
jgi:hypothetical protein